MKFNKLHDSLNNILDGPLLISQEIFNDSRGYFCETWNQEKFNQLLKEKIIFVQDNQSYSKEGTLRGLHYQLSPKAQGKLVRATTGKIYDVIVDLRLESQTFCRWTGLELNSETKDQLWIPPGFAHGFLTTSSEAIVEYKVTNYWDKELDRSLSWNDPDLSIQWPLKNKNFMPNISNKDMIAPSLKIILEKGEVFK
tara:strand:- start:16701 stop:17288 length:588 start_codon:yes stop_codon:yes gene_type:complete